MRTITDEDVEKVLTGRNELGSSTARRVLYLLRNHDMKIVRKEPQPPDSDVVAYVAIGNSDDKLTQAEWSNFIKDIEDRLLSMATEVHGSWFSNPTDPWQNACWCLVFKPGRVQPAKTVLTELRLYYKQDSVAWSVAETEFI